MIKSGISAGLEEGEYFLKYGIYKFKRLYLRSFFKNIF